MVEVRNLLFQPVSLHLAGDGRGFHMGPRERVQIRDDQVSLEMQMAARRGQIALAPVPEDEPETGRGSGGRGAGAGGRLPPTHRQSQHHRWQAHLLPQPWAHESNVTKEWGMWPRDGAVRRPGPICHV